MALALVDCHRVYPPAMPVVPTHDRPDDPVVIYGDQEQVRIAGHLQLNGYQRVIV